MKAMNQKNYIWEQFYFLLTNEEDTFSKIPINKICEQSGIHRSTFYRLFHDKYNLLEFGTSILWNQFTEITIHDRIHRPFQTADSFYKSSKARTLISHHVNDEPFNTFLTDYLLKSFEIEMKHYFEELSLNHFDPSFASKYVISNINFLDNWNKSLNKKLTPKELDSLYNKVILKDLFQSTM